MVAQWERELAFVINEGEVPSARRDALFTVGVDHAIATRVYFARPGTTVYSDTVYNVDEIVSAPAWSPDGRKLAFILRSIDSSDGNGSKAGPKYALHTMNSDDSELRTLAEGFDFGFWGALSWEQNGTDILLSSGGVYVVNSSDGTYSEFARGVYASWSPDGSRIAVIDSSYNYLFTVAPDDSDLSVLVNREEDGKLVAANANESCFL